MTSYTKKLYNRDPAAAEAFHKAQGFEHRLQYGKHTQLAQFGLSHDVAIATFGIRTPSLTGTACDKLCGHPACKQGCTDAGLKARRMAFLDGH